MPFSKKTDSGEKMDKKNMEALFEFFKEKQRVAAGDLSFDSVFCERLRKAASAREASIWKIGKDSRLTLQYGTNISPEDIRNFSFSFGEGITGAVALTRKTIKVTDAWSDQKHIRQVDQKINFRTRSMISAPILFNDILYGVINILNHDSEEEFPMEWEDLMSFVGIMYGMALSNADKLKGQKAPFGGNINAKAKETVIVGVSRSIQDVLDLSMKAGKSKVPVLIYGETGTGKELAARKIHENMENSNGPFLSINCAAIPENILESELFGHVKGAFSGAISDRPGKFVAASGGTLFLDEISEMSQSCQAKILRAIQEKKVVPVGSEKEIEYDARIIAATNRQLSQLIWEGKFRKDLYYRLCGLEIHIPRLCERQSDIPLLIEYFINMASAKETIHSRAHFLPRLSQEALNIFMTYSWPGNVRQLEQAIMAALAVCDDETITVSDLPVWLRRPVISPEEDHDISKNMKSTVVSIKTKYVQALERTCYPGTGRWNVSAAAKLLEIPRKTFVYRIKKMNITQERL